ncbi:unnamed protein product [Adineta ricciae]|uniref:Ig-like domain-containing protein n=1 Tax=Adineta ricciae TaxID=249248 RepID=A0A815LVF2_ADIRI|nr:unnamed protein product [Adineta ricciae]
MKILPTSMSLLASIMSAAFLLGTPVEIYAYGSVYLYYAIAYIIGTYLTVNLFLPKYLQIKCTSIYEYLEKRFSLSVRTSVTSIFVVIYIIYMGVILYGPSLALSQITGLNLWMIVGFAGVICTFYTSITRTYGGMKAVIWTDVTQTVTMFLGVMLSIVFGFMDAGGIEKVFKTAIQGDRLNFIKYITLELTQTAIACLQTQAQRFLCVRDLRSAKRVAWINCFQFIFMLFLTACVGLLLYSKYQSCDPLQAKIISKADQLYPLFVTETLGKIPGLTGIFISCILSASLSSISSGINSIVTVIVEDIYKRIKTSSTISDQQQTIISKILSVSLGALTVCLACLMSYMGNHVLVIVFQIAGSFAAPILGVYLVGFFLRRVNSRSVLIAFFLCLIFQMWILIGSTLTIKQRVRSDGRLSLSIQESTPVDEYHEESFTIRNETNYSTVSTDVETLTWYNRSATETIDESGENTTHVNVQVVVTPNTLRVQIGKTYELTCIVHGDLADTHVYWIQEQPERRYMFALADDRIVSESQVILTIRVTLVHRGNIGEYKCIAEHEAGSTNTATVTMEEIAGYQQPVTWCSAGTKILQIIAPDTIDDDDVLIQCIGAKNKRIDWYLNNRLLVEEEPFQFDENILRIHPASKLCSGEYRCAVFDPTYREARRTLTFTREPSDCVSQAFNPPSPLFINEGMRQLIWSPSGYDFVHWTRDGDDERLPSNVYQIDHNLRIRKARPNDSGIYHCELRTADGVHINVSYEIQVQPTQTRHSFYGERLKITIPEPSINLQEGEDKTILYTIDSDEPVEIFWNRYTDQGYEPMPLTFTVEPDRLILHHATTDVTGIYHVIVRDSHLEVQQTLRINVIPRHQKEQRKWIEMSVRPSEIVIGPGEKVTVKCGVKGIEQYRVTWSVYSRSTQFPRFVSQQGNNIKIAPTDTTPDEPIYLQCQVDKPDAFRLCYAYVTVYVTDGERKKRNIPY